MRRLWRKEMPHRNYLWESTPSLPRSSLRSVFPAQNFFVSVNNRENLRRRCFRSRSSQSQANLFHCDARLNFQTCRFLDRVCEKSIGNYAGSAWAATGVVRVPEGIQVAKHRLLNRDSISCMNFGSAKAACWALGPICWRICSCPLINCRRSCGICLPSWQAAYLRRY